MTEIKIYKNILELIWVLDKIGLPQKEIVNVLEHGESHIKKARELGYQADYCIIFDKKRFTLGTKLYDIRNIPENHLTKIVSAPDTLSPNDILQLNNLVINNKLR